MNKLYLPFLAIFIFITGYFTGSVDFIPGVLRKTSSIQPAGKYTSDYCIKTMTAEKMQQTRSEKQFWFFDKNFSQGLNLKVSEVGPQKARHGAHSHSAEEIFYILEGNAEFSLNGDKKVVPENSAMYCPPGIQHGIKNAGESSMRYLVIRMDDQ